MDVRKSYSLLALVLIIILAFYSETSEACSCMPSHPQTHYCTADYVIIVRVLRKSHNLVAGKIAYKVEIKKSYKMNAEAHQMLKHGRLLTSNSDAGCGVNLDIGKLYMIAGRVPQLGICQYIKEYLKMSVMERRGFSGTYAKGCNCTLQPCFGNQCIKKNTSATSCKWSPFAKCETEHSVCMPTYRHYDRSVAKCHWRRTPAYKACMADP